MPPGGGKGRGRGVWCDETRDAHVLLCQMGQKGSAWGWQGCTDSALQRAIAAGLVEAQLLRPLVSGRCTRDIMPRNCRALNSAGWIVKQEFLSLHWKWQCKSPPGMCHRHTHTPLVTCLTSSDRCLTCLRPAAQLHPRILHCRAVPRITSMSTPSAAASSEMRHDILCLPRSTQTPRQTPGNQPRLERPC